MTQQTSESGIAAVETHSLDQSNLKSLTGGGEGAGAQAISGTGFTYRHDWGPRNGQWKLNLTWAGFTTATRVFVAIGEGTGGGGKFLGGARYTLYNVAPDTGQVGIWLNIEWGSPISLIADYLIIDP